ncbi:MAG: hypothetical protein ACE5NM_05380 [Sedimentisphaerales bacterium]
MNKRAGAAVTKQVAFIMMVIAFGWPLIYGLPTLQGEPLGNRFIAGLFLVILGLVGVFIYLEQIKKEIITALKNQDSND